MCRVCRFGCGRLRVATAEKEIIERSKGEAAVSNLGVWRMLLAVCSSGGETFDYDSIIKPLGLALAESRVVKSDFRVRSRPSRLGDRSPPLNSAIHSNFHVNFEVASGRSTFEVFHCVTCHDGRAIIKTVSALTDDQSVNRHFSRVFMAVQTTNTFVRPILQHSSLI